MKFKKMYGNQGQIMREQGQNAQGAGQQGGFEQSSSVFVVRRPTILASPFHERGGPLSARRRKLRRRIFARSWLRHQARLKAP